MFSKKKTGEFHGKKTPKKGEKEPGKGEAEPKEQEAEPKEQEAEPKKREAGSKDRKKRFRIIIVILTLVASSPIVWPPLLKWLPSKGQQFFKFLLFSSRAAKVLFVILIVGFGILLLYLELTTNPQQDGDKSKSQPSNRFLCHLLSIYEYCEPAILYAFALFLAWSSSKYLDFFLSGENPPIWLVALLCIFIPVGFLLTKLTNIDASNFSHTVGCSLMGLGCLLVILRTVIPGTSDGNAAIFWAGFALFLSGAALLLCDAPIAGGWLDRHCAELAILCWKNTLLANHVSIKGIDIDSDSKPVRWTDPNGWDPEARMFLMDLTSKRKVPLSGIVAVTASLGAIWSSLKEASDQLKKASDQLKEASDQAQKATAQSQGVIAQLLRPIADLLKHNPDLTVGVVAAIIVLATIWQIARSYYWRWLESMRRKIRVEQEESEHEASRETAPEVDVSTNKSKH